MRKNNLRLDVNLHLDGSIDLDVYTKSDLTETSFVKTVLLLVFLCITGLMIWSIVKLTKIKEKRIAD